MEFRNRAQKKFQGEYFGDEYYRIIMTRSKFISLTYRNSKQIIKVGDSSYHVPTLRLICSAVSRSSKAVVQVGLMSSHTAYFGE